MNRSPETTANPSGPPPAAAALGFVLGVALLGLVAMVGAAALV